MKNLLIMLIFALAMSSCSDLTWENSVDAISVSESQAILEATRDTIVVVQTANAMYVIEEGRIASVATVDGRHKLSLQRG